MLDDVALTCWIRLAGAYILASLTITVTIVWRIYRENLTIALKTIVPCETPSSLREVKGAGESLGEQESSGGVVVRALASHECRPGLSSKTCISSVELSMVAQFASAQQVPGSILGDLNARHWSV